MSAVEALQRTLAAEHAAIWLYGLLGGRTSASAEGALYAAITDGYLLHRQRRDELTDRLLALGEEPVAARPSYQEPARARSAVDVRRAAQELEEACAQTYAAQVAETARDQRRWAVEALADASLRTLSLGGDPEPFPGAPELG